jgi:mannosyltransferase OCH1-like enzyme
MLPDYEFIKWDFNKFEKESSTWVAEAFDNKKYAFAADYIRLYAVYNYGGIYMDMDIEVIKSFNELLDQPYMLGYERPSCNGIEAGCFGAEKGNSFVKACLDSYKEKKFVKADGTFELTPLPIIMKKCLDEGDFQYKLFNHNYFTAKSYETGVVEVKDCTYAVHHFAGSWKTDDEKKIIYKTNKLSRFFGYKIGRNIAEYEFAFKDSGIVGITNLTKTKIKKKLKK